MLYICVVRSCFFFFKQKTAYEMRISDWSSDVCSSDLKILKDRRGLYREVILPSGEVWKDYESISFHKMPENERTEYVTWALATLSKWIGIPVETLRHEAEAA